MIPDEVVQEIKRRADIGAVVGRYVKLKRSGRNLVGLCPFHNEKTPSFNVRADEGFYKCFGCDAKGDVIGFLQEKTGQDFNSVVRQLAAEVGVEIPEDGASPEEIARRKEHKRLLRITELAQLYFRGRLRSDEGKPARAYLHDVRGLTDEEIERFALGFGGESDEGLKAFLEREGVSAAEAMKAGVLAEGRRGPYDFFRQRVTFPVRGRSGEVLSFSARAFGESERGRPKYVNGPSSPIYDKSRALYGLHEALPALKKGQPAVLVEGQLDVIATHKASVPTGVAVSGTSLTERHIEELKRYTERVVVCLDSDAAGLAASERAVLLFLAAGVDVSLAELLEKDPDAMVRAGEAEALKTILEGAPPAIEVLVRRAVEKATGSVRARSQAVDQLLPFLAAPPRELLRSQYARLAARALNEDEQLLWKEVEGRGRDLLRKRISGARFEPQPPRPAPAEEPTELAVRPPRPKALVKWTDAERSLALALLTHPLLAPRCGVLSDALRNPELRGFVGRLTEALVRFHDLAPKDALQRVKMPRNSVLFELVRKVMEAGAFEEPDRLLSEHAAAAIIEDFVRRFDQRPLKEQLAEVQRAMAASEERGDHEAWRQLEVQQRALIASLRELEEGLPAAPAVAALPPPPAPETPASLTLIRGGRGESSEAPPAEDLPAPERSEADPDDWDELEAEGDPI